MLNADFIEEQIKNLPKEKQQDLMKMLFKKSRQTVAYFHRINDITLSKLEILADYLGLPLDAFRMNPKATVGNFYGSQNCGNSYYNTNLAQQIEALNKEVEFLKKEVAQKEGAIVDKQNLIKSKEETITSKEETIGVMRIQIDALKTQVDSLKAENKNLKESK